MIEKFKLLRKFYRVFKVFRSILLSEVSPQKIFMTDDYNKYSPYDITSSFVLTRPKDLNELPEYKLKTIMDCLNEQYARDKDRFYHLISLYPLAFAFFFDHRARLFISKSNQKFIEALFNRPIDYLGRASILDSHIFGVYFKSKGKWNEYLDAIKKYNLKLDSNLFYFISKEQTEFLLTHYIFYDPIEVVLDLFALGWYDLIVKYVDEQTISRALFLKAPISNLLNVPEIYVQEDAFILVGIEYLLKGKISLKRACFSPDKYIRYAAFTYMKHGFYKTIKNKMFKEA